LPFPSRNMLGGDNPFSNIHGDVLNATPEDDQSKRNLVEELKNRARAAVGRKNWPEAEALYSKGLEVLPDAILYSNRSLVRLSLDKKDEALADADSAIENDSNYAKGYYRRGQALHKLGRRGEALHAFEAGEAKAPEDKSFKTMVAKLAQEVREKGPNVTAPANTPPPPPSKKKAATASTASPTQTTSKAPVASAPEREVVEGEEELGSEVVRGYRKTADGRTTTYFNNELTEEAKALIGDIAPKQVAGEVKMNVAQGASSWNQAGTWEERDMTGWANGRLPELLVGLELPLPGGAGAVRTTELKKLEGDSQITLSRGKRRFLFEYSFELHWELTVTETGAKAKGHLHFPDMSSDCNGEYEVSVQVKPSAPPEAHALIDRHVRPVGGGGAGEEEVLLRPAVAARLAQFVAELQAK